MSELLLGLVLGVLLGFYAVRRYLWRDGKLGELMRRLIVNLDV